MLSVPSASSVSASATVCAASVEVDCAVLAVLDAEVLTELPVLFDEDAALPVDVAEPHPTRSIAAATVAARSVPAFLIVLNDFMIILLLLLIYVSRNNSLNQNIFSVTVICLNH